MLPCMSRTVSDKLGMYVGEQRGVGHAMQFVVCQRALQVGPVPVRNMRWRPQGRLLERAG